MERAGRVLLLSPIIENHRYLSVWKTVPSEARVTRDEVSGDKNTTMTVWKTVPNYAL